MPRCIKCNYALVLWPHKNKYKCSKCSKVWPQKPIDNNEFRKWNGLQRALTKQEYPDNFEQEWLNYKGLKTEIRQLFKSNRKKDYRKYYLESKDKILAYNRNWRKQHLAYDKKRHKEKYKKNKAIIDYKGKQYRLRNKNKVQERRRRYYLRNIEDFKNKAKERYYKNKDQVNQQRREKRRLKRALALMFEENARRSCLLPKFYTKRPLFTFSTTVSNC